MRGNKRKKQSYHRILLILFALSVLSMPVLAKEKGRVERGGYWLDKDTFVTEYSIPAVYSGEGIFKDADGNLWEFSGKELKKGLKKGEPCILYMSDNGTKEVEDDIVLEAY